MTKLKDVNTTNIPDAIRLGCHTMCSVFNADDNDIPFFGSTVFPEALLSFSPWASEAHVPGRHLNGLLNARDAIGITIDETCIEKHARAAFFSYSGALPLPLNRAEIGGPLVNFMPHNVREGFHALYALAGFTGSERARELIDASVDCILEYWDCLSGWDSGKLKQAGLSLNTSTLIIGLARAIGPLVKATRAAGSSRTLELAILIKEKVIEDFFTEEGGYDPDTFGTHTHSVTCVMSSLAQLADLTSDLRLMNRVRAFYDNGLWDIRNELGWVVETADGARNPDRGEVNNTGDIVETALILGRWGYPRYYEDAERILRCHLLPSQLRDISFIEDPPNPEGIDGKRDVARRHLGAFGFPAPYGHHPIGIETFGFNMDIVGGAVGSLCEVVRQIVRSDDAGHWVNLLFDHETPAVSVESPYTHSNLRVRTRVPGPLFVRIPSWLDRDSIRVCGTTDTPRYSNGYLFLSRPPLDKWVTFEFSLPLSSLTLKHRTRDMGVRLRGDEVAAMDNFGAGLTFFDPIE